MESTSEPYGVSNNFSSFKVSLYFISLTDSFINCKNWLIRADCWLFTVDGNKWKNIQKTEALSLYHHDFSVCFCRFFLSVVFVAWFNVTISCQLLQINFSFFCLVFRHFYFSVRRVVQHCKWHINLQGNNDKVYIDTKPCRENATCKVVYELWQWREAKIDWRSTCMCNRSRCETYEFCRSMSVSNKNFSFFLRFFWYWGRLILFNFKTVSCLLSVP